MLNVVVLLGRLTADPELRSTSSGIAYCRFSVAVDRNYAKSGEERKTDFINCVVWRQQAEFLNRYFTKGQLISVEGTLQQDSYTDRDGNKRTSYTVSVNNISFVGGKKESGGSDTSSYTGSTYGASQRSEGAPKPTYSSGSASDFADSPLDEDLPF